MALDKLPVRLRWITPADGLRKFLNRELVFKAPLKKGQTQSDYITGLLRIVEIINDTSWH